MKVLFIQLPKNTKTPILTYCRKLLENNDITDFRLEIYRNPEYPDVIVKDIRLAALLTVQEDAQVGPRFVKYRKGYSDSLSE
jgi:hypothetical protein